MSSPQFDDPRKLRAILARVSQLAQDHAVPSVMVGLAAREGEPHFPDFISFLQSALRVEDTVFAMTRERAVLHLADLDRQGAREVVERLLEDFWCEIPMVGGEVPAYEIRLFDVQPGIAELRVKDVLKAIFAPDPNRTLH